VEKDGAVEDADDDEVGGGSWKKWGRAMRTASVKPQQLQDFPTLTQKERSTSGVLTDANSLLRQLQQMGSSRDVSAPLATTLESDEDLVVPFRTRLPKAQPVVAELPKVEQPKVYEVECDGAGTARRGRRCQ
jgi:hypothetical protein